MSMFFRSYRTSGLALVLACSTAGEADSGGTDSGSGGETDTGAQTTAGPTTGSSPDSEGPTGEADSDTDSGDPGTTDTDESASDSDPTTDPSTTGTSDPTTDPSTTGTSGTTDATTDPSTTGTTGTTDATTGTTDGTGTGETGTTGGVEIPEWLLSINNQTKWLQKIDINTAETTGLCQLNTSATYTSLTFSRENLLFASRGSNFLERIDPCTCAITPIGSYGGYSGVAGLTSDQDVSLYGVASTQDVLLAVNTEDGVGTEVGPLMVNFGNQGATWSDELQDLYGINANTNGLYTIDHLTGTATWVVGLSINFSTVGIELHPGNGVIYACTGTGILYTVDPENGDTLPVGPIDQTQCSNLAAPYKPVDCIP